MNIAHRLEKNMDMFCNEPIISVMTTVLEDDCDAGSFLDVYNDMAYHVSKGEAIILETEKHYLILNREGVHKISKDEELPYSLEDCMPGIIISEEDEIPWVTFEHTLFYGERLICVREENGYCTAVFDDFAIKIIPYDNYRDVPTLSDKYKDTYNTVHGCDRYLERKCECGGDGEVLLDFVGDYIVRCQKCQRFTWAQMTLESALEEWNNGELCRDLET